MEAVHVDRVDTRSITGCPHGEKVKRVARLGVTVFLHASDDQPCSLLNSLMLTGDALNREDAGLKARKKTMKSIFERIEDPVVYSRLATDPELTKCLSDELEKEQDMKRLEEKFLKLAKNKNVGEVMEALRKYCKWDELLHNVAAVWSKHRTEVDLAHCYPLVSEWIEQYYRKKREKS